MSTQHTPGPWYLSDREIRTEANYQAICEIYKGGPPNPDDATAQANARLIAAAPAMFDALAYVVNWHREHDSGEGELFGLDYVTDCISALRQVDPEWHTTSTQEAHAND